MRDTVSQYLYRVRQRMTRKKRIAIVLLFLSVIVAGSVTWSLHETGQSLSGKDAMCGLEEHTHTEDCTERTAVCGKKESHTHTDECCEAQKVLSCGKEESETHTHSDECYSEKKVLVCGKEEAHTHTDECYEAQKVLSCGKEESETHTHSDECYSEEKVLVCGKEEGHTHTDECYEDSYVCGKEAHTHTADCYADAGSEELTAEETGATASSAQAAAANMLENTAEAGTYSSNENNLMTTSEDSTQSSESTTQGSETTTQQGEETTGVLNIQGNASYATAQGISDDSVEYDIYFNTTSEMRTNGFTYFANFYLANIDADGNVISSTATKPIRTGSTVFQPSIQVYGKNSGSDYTLLNNLDGVSIKVNVDSEPYETRIEVSSDLADDYESFYVTYTGYIGEYPPAGETDTSIKGYLEGRYDSRWALKDDISVKVGTGTSVTYDSTSLDSTTVNFQLVARYIKDLDELLSDFKIYDSSGNDVTSGTLYTNQNYTFRFEFKESNVTGAVVQFAHSEGTELYYQLPSVLQFSATEKMEIVNTEGTVVGHYWVEDNRLKINLDRTENGENINYASEAIKTILDFSLVGSFVSGSAGSNQTLIDNGTLNITVRPNVGSGLSVEKEAGSFDTVTGRQKYTVTIRNTGSEVTDISFTEEYDAKLDWARLGTVLKYAAGGSETTVYTTALTVASSDNTTNSDGFHTTTVSGLGNLESGEYFLVTYYLEPNNYTTATIDDDTYTNGDYSEEGLVNIVTVNGKIDGEEIELKPTDKESVSIEANHLNKYDYPKAEAYTRQYNDSTDSTLYAYVRWDVYIGTGEYEIQGAELNDTLTSGNSGKSHTYCFNNGLKEGSTVAGQTYGAYDRIVLTFTTEAGEKVEYDLTDSSSLLTKTDGTGTPALDSFTLTLPDTVNGSAVTYKSATLTYYSKMESPEIDSSNTGITADTSWPMGNTITATLNGRGYYDRAVKNLTPNPGVENLEKTAEFSEDGKYAEYTVTADIPGDMNGRTLFIWDYLTLDFYDAKTYTTKKIYPKNIPEMIEVSAEDESGNIYTFEDAETNENAAYSYLVDTDAYDSVHRFHLNFNIAYNETDSVGHRAYMSNWNIEEDTTLTIRYRVALDEEAYMDGEGTQLDTRTDTTIRSYIEDSGYTLENQVKVNDTYYDYAYLRQNGPAVSKTAEVVDEDEGIYKYTVFFYNYNPDTDENYMDANEVLRLKLTDTFDENLEYYEDSTYKFDLKWLQYNTGQHLYQYKGSSGGIIRAFYNKDGTAISKDKGITVADNSISLSLTNLRFLDDAGTQFGYLEGGLCQDWRSGGTISNIVDDTKNHKYYTDKGTRQAPYSELAGFVFTYYLKVEDSADAAATSSLMTLDNTAQISTTYTYAGDENPPTALSDTAEVTYTTSVFSKEVEQQKDTNNDGTNYLDYIIELNPNRLALNEGKDMVVVDELQNELELGTSTLKVYEIIESTDDEGNVTETTNELTLDYILEGQTLKVTVPDSKYIRITFTCKVPVSAAATASISNTAYVEGREEKVEAETGGTVVIQVVESTASQYIYQFYIKKLGQIGDDKTTSTELEGVTFDLYSDVADTSNTAADYVPEGVDKTITENGNTYYWWAEYTTDESGNALITHWKKHTSSGINVSHSLRLGTQYVLREREAPDGYAKGDDYVFVFADSTYDQSKYDLPLVYNNENLDTNKIGITFINESSYELPEAGGVSVNVFYVVGGLVCTAVLLYLFIGKHGAYRR